jgi:hypothetical protein
MSGRTPRRTYFVVPGFFDTCRALTGAALLVVSLLPATAAAGQFAVLSYNVRGLPPEVIENRTDEMEAIALKLEDFHTAGGSYEGIDSVVGLQEVFFQSYYNILTDPQTVTYPYVTAKDNSGPAGIGDGLTILSDFQLDSFSRTGWTDCFGSLGQNGSDCDTNKGFTFAQVTLETGVSFDLYTLHADAGQDSGSQEARRDNITQLATAINLMSPDDRAVVVLGDTNSLYTRVGDDNLQDLLNTTGLTDVWVQLRRSGIVPTAGAPIEEDCVVDPDSGECELVDKIFYRDGNTLALAPLSYNVLDTLFSDEGGDLSDHYPVTVTFDYAVVTTTTTTTSTSSTSSTSTSTTMEPDRPCADPIGPLSNLARKRAAAEAADAGLAFDTRAVGAADALFVLKAAVGALDCPLCTCDIDNNGNITATDALRTLKIAVGQDIPLNCPPCV